MLKKAKQRLRRVARTLSIRRDRTLHIDGINLSVDMNDGGGRQYRDSRREWLNEARSGLWSAIQRECYPARVVDVGANYGFMSCLFARSFPQAAIVAVEPDPHPSAYLRRNLERACPGRFQVVAALCAEAATESRPFAFNLDYSQDNRVIAGSPETGKWRTVEAPAICLDSIVGEVGEEFVFVKIDVQGFEERVIRGGARLFARNNWLVKMEFAPRWLRSHDTPPVDFLAELSTRFAVAEYPARFPFGATLADCFRRPLTPADAASFTAHFEGEDGGGWGDLLVRPRGR